MSSASRSITLVLLGTGIAVVAGCDDRDRRYRDPADPYYVGPTTNPSGTSGTSGHPIYTRSSGSWSRPLFGGSTTGGRSGFSSSSSSSSSHTSVGSGSRGGTSFGGFGSHAGSSSS